LRRLALLTSSTTFQCGVKECLGPSFVEAEFCRDKEKVLLLWPSEIKGHSWIFPRSGRRYILCTLTEFIRCSEFIHSKSVCHQHFWVPRSVWSACHLYTNLFKLEAFLALGRIRHRCGMDYKYCGSKTNIRTKLYHTP